MQDADKSVTHVLACGCCWMVGCLESGAITCRHAWQDALWLFFFYRWVFIYEKGYQSTDTAVSSVYSKMKGVGYTNVNGSERIWDVADYVFPSQVGVRSARAFRGRWNVDCVCHTTPNWSVLCFPSAASHRPLLTGLWWIWVRPNIHKSMNQTASVNKHQADSGRHDGRASLPEWSWFLAESWWKLGYGEAHLTRSDAKFK